MKLERIDRLTHLSLKSGLFPYQLDVSVFLADGLLIDAGSGNTEKKIAQWLKNEKLSGLAITHVHEDHTGAAWWVQRHFAVPVYIHKKSIAEANLPSDVPLYRRLVWGNRKAFHPDPIPDFIETENYRFDIYDAPGHHPYHIVLQEKNMGWIFTGDLYVGRKQFVAFKDENISDAIESLKKILQLDFDTVFCSHSGIQKNGKEKIKAKLQFFEDIRGQVVNLRRKGLAPEEIAKIVFPNWNLWAVVSKGEWSALNIINTI